MAVHRKGEATSAQNSRSMLLLIAGASVLVILFLVALSLSLCSPSLDPAHPTPVVSSFYSVLSLKAMNPPSSVLREGSLETWRGENFTIFQLYHGREGWPFLFCKERNFRGMSQSPGSLRTDCEGDVDATSLLAILHDSYYQNALCEYSAMFALEQSYDTVHGLPWIGFQSWRAIRKNVSLTPPAVWHLRQVLANGSSLGAGNVMFLWSDVGEGNPYERDSQFYESCDLYHKGNCRSMFAAVFRRLFQGVPPSAAANVNSGDDAAVIPPMPLDGDSWAYMSYWVMTREMFIRYCKLARVFFVVLDGLYYTAHHDRNECLLADDSWAPGEYLQSHCWCFLVERLVNIWAYHSGVRFIKLHHITGNMHEYHPLPARAPLWSSWFGEAAPWLSDDWVQRTAAQFEHGAELLQRLGGPPAAAAVVQTNKHDGIGNVS